MCIIILNKKNLIDKDTFITCCEKNPDGMGILYSESGKLQSFKELEDVDLFYDFYKSVREKNPKNPIGLHFRIATHGNIDEKNTHPFYVDKNLAFMHNGIINIKLSKDSEISDTIAFNEKILKGLDKGFLRNKSILELITRYIGTSKLLFIDNKNHYHIINESLGIWQNDNWYSNYSYCDYKDDYKDYSYLYSDYDKDYLSYSKVYGDFEECEECGKILKSVREYDYRLCNECIKKYDLI